MEDLKIVVVYAVGGIMTLLSPIHNFMLAMLILFGLNFFFGLVAAVVNKEKWSMRKAMMFFVYVMVFMVTACSTFVIGKLMGENEQAVAVVKILCFVAIYIFGTNIFRNLSFIAPKGTAWHRFFDLCYYALSVKFIEKLDFVKKWQTEREGESHNTILDKDDN